MSKAATPADTVVEISSGRIRGAVVDGVHRFLSVPYAAAPRGLLRFFAPRTHAGWVDVRDALTVGPSAPQHTPSSAAIRGIDLAPLMGEGAIPGEDFLCANVWTPDPTARELPVMLFIHGGAFLFGSKDAPVYDGAAFARDGVVLISINYRLGLEGFVHMPAGDSNLGLRDCIAALAWVHKNAAHFGGDPHNVTVFGESAGAMIISDLITSPLAKGLFQRAIVQSGHGGMVRSIPVALRLTEALARHLKVGAEADGFGHLTPEACLPAVAWASEPNRRIDMREADKRDSTYSLSKFLPVYGDEVLPERPLEALKAGAGAEIDLLIGTNRDEMNLYLVPTGVIDKVNGLLAWYMLSRVQPHARSVLKDFGLGRREAGVVYGRAMDDLVFRWPARRFAEEHRGSSHVYEFGWRSDACGGRLGACHGLELPFVFNTLACATGAQGLAGPNPPQSLADEVHRLWVGFARDGSLPWGQYRAEDRQVYALETGSSAAEPVSPAAKHLP